MLKVKNRKSGHHQSENPHIQISLSVKFHFKLIILIILNRFAQKGFFWSKTVNVNTAYFLHNSAYLN